MWKKQHNLHIEYKAQAPTHRLFYQHNEEEYLESSTITKMEHFARIGNG